MRGERKNLDKIYINISDSHQPNIYGKKLELKHKKQNVSRKKLTYKHYSSQNYMNGFIEKWLMILFLFHCLWPLR